MGDLFNRLDRENKPSAIEGERKFADGRMGVGLSRKDLGARKGAEAAAMTGNLSCRVVAVAVGSADLRLAIRLEGTAVSPLVPACALVASARDETKSPLPSKIA